jgi:hypothetical protein
LPEQRERLHAKERGGVSTHLLHHQ